jgi:cell fate (sporulation/competence/biofilm development) regulator YlbF (YheA/YmcA/DUF963 family)
MAQIIQTSANELSEAIRSSEEFNTLKKLYEEVNIDPTAKELFAKFRNMQLDIQQKQMAGQDISQDEVIKAQAVVSDVQKNEKIAKLMEAEEKMNNVIVNINQVVLKPLEELYGSVNQ